MIKKLVNKLDNWKGVNTMKHQRSYFIRNGYGFLFLSLSIILYSCSSNNKQSTVPIVKITENCDTIFASKFFTKTKVIVLENKKEAFFGDISKILFFDGKFIIHDYKTKKIFVFGENGNFLYSIGTKGKGPGEYIRISSFTINEKAKEIAVYDYNRRGFGFHRISDGSFLRFEEDTRYFQHFSIDGQENTIVYSPNMDFSPGTGKGISIINKKTKKVARILPIGADKKYYSIPSMDDEIVGFGKSIYFTSFYTDTIFKIANGSCKPAYYLDFGSFNLPGNYRFIIDSDDNRKRIREASFVMFKGLRLCSDQLLVLQSYFNHKDHLSFIVPNHGPNETGSVFYNDINCLPIKLPIRQSGCKGLITYCEPGEYNALSKRPSDFDLNLEKMKDHYALVIFDMPN